MFLLWIDLGISVSEARAVKFGISNFVPRNSCCVVGDRFDFSTLKNES